MKKDIHTSSSFVSVCSSRLSHSLWHWALGMIIPAMSKVVTKACAYTCNVNLECPVAQLSACRRRAKKATAAARRGSSKQAAPSGCAKKSSTAAGWSCAEPGFLLRDVILSYHNQATTLFYYKPLLKLNALTRTQEQSSPGAGTKATRARSEEASATGGRAAPEQATTARSATSKPRFRVLGLLGFSFFCEPSCLVAVRLQTTILVEGLGH